MMTPTEVRVLPLFVFPLERLDFLLLILEAETAGPVASPSSFCGPLQLDWFLSCCPYSPSHLSPQVYPEACVRLCPAWTHPTATTRLQPRHPVPFLPAASTPFVHSSFDTNHSSIATASSVRESTSLRLPGRTSFPGI